MTNGKKNEFLHAYDTYSEAIYRHCFFRVFSKERAEELVQETFLRTWEYIKEGKEVQHMKSFLYQVANRLVIDNARKKKEESLEVLLEISETFEPSYEEKENFESQFLLRDIKQAMEKLEPRDREVITLRFIDDLDPKEIASVLGLNSNVVSVRLNRAMNRLKEIAGEGN